jgi:Cu(I)/Ag(I) efflux system membrane protein CusA/SilA
VGPGRGRSAPGHSGGADVYPEQVTGASYLDIRVKREAAARYGISVGAIQGVIETAVGEMNLTMTIEERQRFPVRVRLRCDWAPV